MSKVIDFYFDFISPYSYIAHQKIKLIDIKDEIKFDYKPILLGGLHKLGNITAPAFNERKMKNMKNDCEIISKKNKISFKWNDKFPINSLYLMRGFISIDPQFKNKYLDTCFDAYWKNNIDISIEKNINNILDACKIDKKNFFDKIQEQQIKDELKSCTDEAFKKDIFGAPTFVINNKLFWGQDRLEYAIDECIVK
ncbi:2-hydroxychromene-2-carboxylate isomerase [Candidatus Pelagibacter sp. HIMB1483]|uniref:2-hydroxychromene-2-carboxylate isomerase n=1 Tax=Candidatus Pelagibacter sp. HIMB1483 TaxID=3415414 RepID=UPI003F84C91A